MNRSNESASEWSTSGRDLLVSLQDTSRGAWGERLCDQIRDAVRSGSLRAGVRLPATRALAHDLGVSRGLICGVYDQLKAEGYLIARPGSATTVADIGSISNTPGGETTPVRTRPDRSPGLPDPRLFPRQQWLHAYRRVLDQLPDTELHYPDPQGYLPLREQLADYLGRVRGLRTRASHILIVNGYAQGLAIIATVLRARGITEIAVEEPGSTGTRTQLATWGISTPPVHVDDDGLNVRSLQHTGAAAVLLTPAHHYPTGVVLTPDRRHQLLDWVAGEPGRYIIEDDYDAEYRYDLAPVGSLQPLNPHRVITGSSVSKTLSPALRLGWLVLPDELIVSATEIKASFDLGNALLDQATIAELLRTGVFDQHLRKSRRRYRAQRQQLVDHLHEHLPELTMTGLDAGLNICIRLPRHVNDHALAERLKADGVSCAPLSHYQQLPNGPRGLVIDIAANTPTHLHTIVSAARKVTA